MALLEQESWTDQGGSGGSFHIPPRFCPLLPHHSGLQFPVFSTLGPIHFAALAFIRENFDVRNFPTHFHFKETNEE